MDSEQHRPAGAADRHFEVAARDSGSARILDVSGEIDMTTGPLLTAELHRRLADHPPVLVVDLSAVTFLSSPGLAALMNANREAADTALRVVAGSPVVLRPIQIVGLDALLAVYPSQADALADTGRIGSP